MKNIIFLTVIFFVFTGSSFSQLSDSLKIVNKSAGWGYAYQGKKISFSNAGRIIAKNPEAFEQYVYASSRRSVGNILLGAGAGILLVGSAITVALTNENKGSGNVFIGVIIGLPIMAASIPFHISAKHFMTKAINTYNRDLGKSASGVIQGKIGLTSHGAGIVVHF